MPGSVFVSGARTPIGRFNGGLANFTGAELGSHAISAALERSGITGDQVDHVVMGQVLQAGQGQITARQAAVGAGIPMDVPAITINKVCLSGLNAVYLADQMISSGDAEVVVAGGMESMTNAPYLLADGRNGLQMGHGEVRDAMIHDGLWCAFDDGHMGDGTERDAAGISRTAMDEFSAQSHERAAAAQKDGRFEAEISPVSVAQRGGDPLIVDTDEGVRPGTTAESLAKLRAAFATDGSVTAGNASQISDGGCALVMMSPRKAEELGIENASTLRKQEILFAILKKVAEKEEITGAGVLQLLQDGQVTRQGNLEGFLEPMEAALLESERLRLLPLIDELRDNAENAWHRRIMREMGQLAEANWRAQSEGNVPDPRWIRMKNGLITKLQDELARRLAELDQIRDGLEARLDLQIAIRIE